MKSFIWIIESLLFLFTCTTITIVYHLNKDTIHTFFALSRLVDSWNKKPISSLRISEVDDCFGDKSSNKINYHWPGTIKGCDCNEIRYSWVLQFEYREYRRKVWPSPCNQDQYKTGCINITETRKRNIKKWRDHYFCANSNNDNNAYFNLTISNQCDDRKHKTCGTIDTLGNVLCVDKNQECPHSAYELQHKGNDLKTFWEKHDSISKKYIKEKDNDHETHKYDMEIFTDLGMTHNTNNKPTLKNNRIPIDLKLSDDAIICLNDEEEKNFKEGEFNLFKNKIAKNSTCVTAINEYNHEDIYTRRLIKEYYTPKPKEKTNDTNSNTTNNDNNLNNDYYYDEEEEDLSPQPVYTENKSKVINRFNVIDEYNKHIYYDQNKIAQNFMHSKKFPSLRDHNISLFDEIYIGWKPSCSKLITGDLFSSIKTFKKTYENKFSHIKFHILYLFTLSIILMIFLMLKYFSKKSNPTYNKNIIYVKDKVKIKTKQSFFYLWYYSILIFISCLILRLVWINISKFNEFETINTFIYNLDNCSDDFSNILLDAFKREYLFNYKVFLLVGFIAILNIILSIVMSFTDFLVMTGRLVFDEEFDNSGNKDESDYNLISSKVYDSRGTVSTLTKRNIYKNNPVVSRSKKSDADMSNKSVSKNSSKKTSNASPSFRGKIGATTAISKKDFEAYQQDNREDERELVINKKNK